MSEISSAVNNNMFFSELIDRLNERLSIMEKWNASHCNIGLDLEKRIEEIEKWKEIAIQTNIQDMKILRELEKTVGNLESLSSMINRSIKIFQDNGRLKPHKCPVCDGNGRINLKEPLITKNSTCYSISCVPCEERGIVWG